MTQPEIELLSSGPLVNTIHLTNGSVMIQCLNINKQKHMAQNTQVASLQRGKFSPEYPGYNTKQSNGEAPIMLEFWRIPF